MGNISGYLVEGGTNPALDAPDVDTGLTPSEKMAVKRIWDIVRADIKHNGIDLLIMFFEENPSYQGYFKAFKDVPMEDLPTNTKFQAHAKNVMYAFTSVVDSLDDTGCLVEMLIKLGQNHYRHGISRQEFYNLKTTLIKLLKVKLGPEFTTEDEAAWNKTIDVAYSIIFQGLDKSQASVS